MTAPTVDQAQTLDASAGRLTQRANDQLQTDMRTCLTVLGFYLIDALLLAGYCAQGVGQWASPAAFVLTGVLVAGGHALWLTRAGSTLLKDSTLGLVQTGAALLLVILVGLADRPLAAPMLLTVVVIIPTSALRMTPRWLGAVCVMAALASIGLVMAHDGQLSLPTHSTGLQVVTGLFVLWTLLKGAAVNVMGMSMRLALDDSHVQLASALARVEELAGRDQLTGLYNRRRVMDALEQERRSSTPTSLSA